ncbi:MAG TPA: hypothetical protein VFV27_06705 [Nevskiaceae bacterium]|nr:hypothetical protein [Nevskiaceae bacterium]
MSRITLLLGLLASLTLTPVLAQDEAASEDEAADSGVPLYLAAERARLTLDISDPALMAELGGADRYDSDFWRVRAGWRVFPAVALELQTGFADSDGRDPGEVELSEFYNFSIVPTGVFLELIEVSARIGYGSLEVERGAGRYSAEGLSYGLNVELPLRLLVEGAPDLRLTSGVSIYQEETRGRFYGYHYGLRYDFDF